MGEDLAAAFLRRQGLTVVGRNVRVGRGELDIVVRDSRGLIAVEVKSISDRGADPTRSYTRQKDQQVRRLGRQIGCYRTELVVVEFQEAGALFRWFRAQ